MYIYPYRDNSKSVKNLRAAMNCKIIRRENSKLKPSEDNFIINWGSSESTPQMKVGKVINHPIDVRNAVNKLSFFNIAAEKGCEDIPDYTTDPDTAHEWIKNGKVVVVREILTGHSGVGIVLLNNQIDWEQYDHRRAKLYVLYIPKKYEYRVHVVRDEVIDVRRKAMNPDHAGPYNHQIRNHANGFIYAIDMGHEVNPKVTQLALEIIDLMGLDFGAVDIIWNDSRQRAYALEINCAPGLEGRTVESYANAFNKLYEEFKNQ